jgi:hypothetical protein
MVTKKTLPLAVELFNTTSSLHRTDAVDPPGVPGLPDLHGVVMTAFDPLLGEGLADLRPVSGELLEQLNIWQVDLPSDFGRNMGYTPSICQPVALNATEPGDTPQCQMFPFQLWVVTSDDAFICTLGNGTRTANFNFVDGEQTISYSDLRDFDPVFAPRQIFLNVPDGNTTKQIDVDYQLHSYMSVYLPLQNMLSGNLTMWIPWTSPTPPFLADQSFVLRTGLDACDSIKNNTWSQNYTNDLFEKPDYMCRNRSLARAIEDLAANVTISMMTSSDLTYVYSVNVPLFLSMSHSFVNASPLCHSVVHYQCSTSSDTSKLSQRNNDTSHPQLNTQYIHLQTIPSPSLLWHRASTHDPQCWPRDLRLPQ